MRVVSALCVCYDVTTTITTRRLERGLYPLSPLRMLLQLPLPHLGLNEGCIRSLNNAGAYTAQKAALDESLARLKQAKH
jgi:hypothetical protein